jgi:hypothetical protein
VELTDPGVDAGLRALAPADQELARPALEWLVGAHGLDRLHQTGLQQFLWYELPFKWLGPVSGRHRLVAALARFFDQSGLARYARLCRSATTTEILDRWATDPDDGFSAFHRAHLASGVVPPDTPRLQWGDLMGSAELDAFWSTAQALELAVEGGALVPGRPHWRARQESFVAEHLDRPRADHFGEAWAEEVAGERLRAWLDDGLGDARSAIVAPVANQLLHDLPIPRTASRSMRSLAWLASRLAAAPVKLTSSGALPARIVAAACDELGWTPDSPRGRESDVGVLVEMRATAERIGLVRVRRGHMLTTARGRAALESPRSLWSHLVADATARRGFTGEVDELVDAVLLDSDRLGGAGPHLDELTDVVRVPLTERGWHAGGTGRPVPDRVLRPALAAALDFRVGLAAVATRRGRPVEPLGLTQAGRALAVGRLRARALAPRRA